MDSNDIQKIVSEVEAEDSLFASKAYLDTLTFLSKIIGRQEKAKELVKLLMGYKQGFLVPFISVYGRSGSGKSAVVKFVCNNIPGVSCCFVNLRKAKTVFGCCNLILAELGIPSLKSAQGLNVAVERISEAIEAALNGKLFILVLDEFDVIFYDRRGKPSDFIYKLLVMEEKLREKGILVTTIAISNNVMADYEIDDRVRSRIGSSEVFFPAYTKKEVTDILQDRAKSAFSKPVDPDIFDYCAELSSGEHGDARRAIDLLRVAAEIAGTKGQNLSKAHVNEASEQLQKDRLSLILSTASFHLKGVASALARVSYLTEEEWHSTATIYNQYKQILAKGTKPLTYRRVSELLTELENTGIVLSQTSSRGRQGYGTQYKLTAAPAMVASACFPEWWKGIAQHKEDREKQKSDRDFRPKSSRKSTLSGMDKLFDYYQDTNWDSFVGV